MIINIEFKSKLFRQILTILNQEKKRPKDDYGHDENEWGYKDDSEKIEWEEHYKRRNGKLEKEDDEI